MKLIREFFDALLTLLVNVPKEFVSSVLLVFFHPFSGPLLLHRKWKNQRKLISPKLFLFFSCLFLLACFDGFSGWDKAVIKSLLGGNIDPSLSVLLFSGVLLTLTLVFFNTLLGLCIGVCTKRKNRIVQRVSVASLMRVLKRRRAPSVLSRNRESLRSRELSEASYYAVGAGLSVLCVFLVLEVGFGVHSKILLFFARDLGLFDQLKNIVIFEQFDGTSSGSYQIISPLHFAILSPILIFSFLSASHLIWIRIFRSIKKSAFGIVAVCVTASLFVLPVSVVMVLSYGFYENLKTLVTKTAEIRPFFCVVDKERKVSAYLFVKNGNQKRLYLDVSGSKLSLYVPKLPAAPNERSEGYEFDLDLLGSNSKTPAMLFSLGLGEEGWLAFKSSAGISKEQWKLYKDVKPQSMHCSLELGEGSPIAKILGQRSFGFFGIPELRGKVFVSKPKI